MKRFVICLMLTVLAATFCGCATMAKVDRLRTKYARLQLDPANKTVYAGVDLAKLGVADAYADDRSGTALAVGVDAMAAIVGGITIYQGGKSLGYWGHKDSKTVTKTEKADQPTNSGNNGGDASGNGNGGNGGDTVNTSGDGNTIIINKGLFRWLVEWR